MLSLYIPLAHSSGRAVILRLNAGCLRKGIPANYSSVIWAVELLLRPCVSEERRRLRSLYVVRVLCTWIHRTQVVCSCDQLFVWFADLAGGKALSKQQLSQWIVGISLVCSSSGLPLTYGVKAHWTRGVAHRCAHRGGLWVSVSALFVMATWSSLHTFVQYCHKDMTAPSVVHSVLPAGSTTLWSPGLDPGVFVALQAMNMCPVHVLCCGCVVPREGTRRESNVMSITAVPWRTGLKNTWLPHHAAGLSEEHLLNWEMTSSLRSHEGVIIPNIMLFFFCFFFTSLHSFRQQK